MSSSGTERKFQPRAVSTVMTIIMVTVMLSLGLWQLQRLEWKTALIAHIDSQMTAKPVPMPEQIEHPDVWEFRRVTLAGQFLFDREFMLGPRTQAGQVGKHMLVPFRRVSGGTVFINRGWVPDDKKAELTRPEGIVLIEGVIRQHEKNAFTPDNNAEGNTWYWADVPAMAAAAKLDNVPPIVVEAVAGKAGVYPQGGIRAANLRNDHKQYAIFWFGMALVMVAVYVLSSLHRQKNLEEKNASL